MLNLDSVKEELKTHNFEYNNNVLCGHTKSKVKWVLPTGVINVIAFEKATGYLFGFTTTGINIFSVEGDWHITENCLIPWSEVRNFKMKKGLLLENEMLIETAQMKIEMKINRKVVNNPWVKENVESLEANNYYRN